MIGTTVAHYRMRAAIGAGGLGAVYRATDSLWTARRTGGGAQRPAGVACAETRLATMARQELAKLRWDSEMIERLIDGLRKARLDITG